MDMSVGVAGTREWRSVAHCVQRLIRGSQVEAYTTVCSSTETASLPRAHKIRGS